MQIQLNGPHGELAGLIPWLDVAYQDAATSVENDRISVCGDCRQDCDMTDMEYCAECKRVVCGDCYLESGHMQHDPERGLAYDDLVMEAA